MSIPFSGTLRRSGGEVSAIGKQLRLVNLKAAKRIVVKFDPFGERIKHTRDFAHYISSSKIGLTNPNCIIKTEVICDRSEPSIHVNIVPSVAESSGIKNVQFQSGNLTCLEILKLLNQHISKLAPIEEPVSTIQTKSEKKGKRK